MAPDEQQIRELVRTWMQATRAGDVATVLGLMTEDVEQGRWKLARDATLLATVPQGA